MNKIGKITKEADGYKVVFNRTLHHPIERVWDAITNPKELSYWFTDIKMDFRQGGKITFTFRDKDKTSSYGEIISIDPPYKFVWSWEGEVAVWELKSVGEKITQLTLTYSKLKEDYAISAPAGFHDLLDQLADRLNGSQSLSALGAEETLPTNTKVHYQAAVYEDFPQLIKDQPLIIEKLYNAPVEKVWKAITDKEQMQHWYFDLDAFTLEEGFRFEFSGQGHKGEKYRHLCTITEIIPMQKLQYSWQYAGLQGYSLVTFTLLSVGDKTSLKLTHHGLETFPKDNADFAWTSFHEGWSHLIGISLPEFVENRKVASMHTR